MENSLMNNDFYFGKEFIKKNAKKAFTLYNLECKERSKRALHWLEKQTWAEIIESCNGCDVKPDPFLDECDLLFDRVREEIESNFITFRSKMLVKLGYVVA